MNLSQTLEDVAAVAKSARITSSFETACLSTSYEDITSVDTVWQRIDAFRPDEGWFCCQSSIYRFTDSKIPRMERDRDGRLLSGELVQGERSLHIRQHDAGWRLFLFEEAPATSESGAMSPVQQRNLLLAEASDRPTYLHYRVFWRHDDETGFVPDAARFCGFRTE